MSRALFKTSSDARRIVNGIKELIRKTDDPAAKESLAKIGLTYTQISLMDGHEEKVCRKCGLSLPIDRFGFVSSVYKTKKGEQKKVMVRRNNCYQCTYPKKKKKVKSEYTIGNIQVY